MEIIAIANLFVFVVVWFISIFGGLDLKKSSSWLIALYGFLSGFLIGFVGGGISTGLQGGVLFATVVLFSGIIMSQHRKRYNKDAVEEWLSHYGQDKRFSLLARIMKELLKK